MVCCVAVTIVGGDIAVGMMVVFPCLFGIGVVCHLSVRHSYEHAALYTYSLMGL